MNRSTIRITLVLSLVVFTGTAGAQATAEQAKKYFTEGRSLMAEGKLTEACRAFRESQRLEPRTTTLFNLADCEQKSGHFGTAWRLFARGEKDTAEAHDEALAAMHATAHARVAELDARASKLVISVDTHATGLEIRRDGEVVDPNELDRAIPIDGGAHTVVARAPGYDEWTTRFEIENEGKARSVAIHLQKTPPPVRGPSRVLPIAATAAAALFVAGAVGFKLSGDDIYHRAAQEPDNTEQGRLLDDANGRRHTAIALGVVGVATAGGATWLWLRRSRHEHPQRPAVMPVAGSGTLGVQVSGRW